MAPQESVGQATLPVPNRYKSDRRRYRPGVTGRPTFEDFETLGFRVGTVLRAEMNEGAREAAYRLWIDLGDEEPAQSSAKITELYGVEDLVGRQVVVVTGFEAIRVGGFRSDVLVIGALGSDGVVLLEPDTRVAPGTVVA